MVIFNFLVDEVELVFVLVKKKKELYQILIILYKYLDFRQCLFRVLFFFIILVGKMRGVKKELVES